MIGKNRRMTAAGVLALALLWGAFLGGSAEAAKEGTGRTVVDHLGRSVEIPATPRRILALNPNMMEFLYILGYSPVGKVEEYEIRAEGTALPGVGRQNTVNVEAVYGLKPDLIFGNVGHMAPIMSVLEQTGAAIVALDAKRSDDALLGVLHIMAEALGKEDAAAEYKALFDSVVEEGKRAVREKHPDIRSMVILQGGVESVLAFMPGNFHSDLVGRLGLRNIVPTDFSRASKEIPSAIAFDLETIVAEDPDVIFIRTAGRGGGSTLERLRNDPAWSGLKAVREKRVVTMPGKINPGRIELHLAVRWIADQLCSAEAK